ncbi:MAG: sigma-70 family RNA polymerase sigma factor, partial [Acidobacteria bacterium]|nr:sigma-70 family RNA polymerase sigma factor [Acidobacteriota bacterium]
RWVVPMIDPATGDRDVSALMPSRDMSPEDAVMLNERRRRLWSALARLPERQRTIFMLSHYEGYSSKEVSGMTGLNESTVRVHLFRAIRKLRALLAPSERTEDERLQTEESGEVKNAIR